MPTQQVITPQLGTRLAELTQQTGRRIGLLIDRRGEIDKVIVGDAHRVFLPDLGPRRAGASRFRGVRLVLSSLRPDGLTEEDQTDLTLLQLDAVAVVQALPDGTPGTVHVGTLLPPEADAPWQIETFESVHKLRQDFADFLRDLEAQFTRSPRLQEVADRTGVLLVGVSRGEPSKARRSMQELERLADTAGLTVVNTHLQNRRQVDGKTWIGTGKLQELLVEAMHTGAEALIFDGELSPSQLRNVAQLTDLKVLDRTQLILDIFAGHATSREGRLQVELAQLRYRMPRLALMPTAMSRLTGGIGGRGPGETKLEINRRRAQERLTRLERQLEQLAKNRATRRKKRQRNDVPVVSLVGYTNAGKSTLLNRVTQSEVRAEDRLFATLDPTSRRFRLPEERELILTDTVGFIQDLPETLRKAFRSTLEELEHSELLVHVLDASDPDVELQKADVEQVLSELDLEDTPALLLWNKADIADPDTIAALQRRHGGLVCSAETGAGVDKLLEQVEARIFQVRAAHQAG